MPKNKNVDGVKKMSPEEREKSKRIVLESIEAEAKKQEQEKPRQKPKPASGRKVDGIFSIKVPESAGKDDIPEKKQKAEKPVKQEPPKAAAAQVRPPGPSRPEPEPEKIDPAKKKRLEEHKKDWRQAFSKTLKEEAARPEPRPASEVKSDTRGTGEEKAPVRSVPETRPDTKQETAVPAAGEAQPKPAPGPPAKEKPAKPAPEIREKEKPSISRKKKAEPPKPKISRKEARKLRLEKAEELRRQKDLERARLAQIKRREEEEAEARKQEEKRARQKKIKAAVRRFKRAVTAPFRAAAAYFGAFVAAVRKALFIMLVSTVLLLMAHSVLSFVVLQNDLDSGWSRFLNRYLPIPALITDDGVVDYYTYRDARESLAATGMAKEEAVNGAKLAIIRNIIIRNLLKKYELPAEGNIKARVNERILSDQDINIVAINRISKIKQLLEEDGDFVKNAMKLGDELGQLTITDDNVGSHPGGEKLRALEAGEDSDVIVGDKGYYIYHSFDKTPEKTSLSYVVVKGMMFDSYVSEAVGNYRIWSLVD